MLNLSKRLITNKSYFLQIIFMYVNQSMNNVSVCFLLNMMLDTESCKYFTMLMSENLSLLEYSMWTRREGGEEGEGRGETR